MIQLTWPHADPFPLPDNLADLPFYCGVQIVQKLIGACAAAGHDPSVAIPDPNDLLALYDYEGQVGNGGHSQFIHNAHGASLDHLQKARRAADFLDLPNMVSTIDACADFIAQHPELVAKQDGFGNNRKQFGPMDSAIRDLKYDALRREAAINQFPQDAANRIRIFLSGSQAKGMIAAAAAAANDAINAGQSRADAYLAGLNTARPLYNQRSSDPDAKIRDDLAHFNKMQKISVFAKRSVSTQIELSLTIRFVDEPMYSDSKLMINAALWLQSHPAAIFIPAAEYDAKLAIFFA